MSYGDNLRFRPKKKVGQIYINIPGVGSMSMEEDPKHVGNLRPALEAAKKVFNDVYTRLGELTKDEYYDVHLIFRPEADRAELDKDWEEYQEAKRLHEEEKKRASEE